MNKETYPKKILLTGATGFIGSHLGPELVGQGFEVHALLRPSSDATQLLPAIQIHREGTQSLASTLDQIRPDVIIHLATLFLAQHKMQDIAGLIESNIAFGTRLLEAAVLADVKRFVNASTFWQESEGGGYNPANLYAATKQAFEDVLIYYTKSSDLTAISLRLFDTYGPGDPRRKLFYHLTQLSQGASTSLKMSAGVQKLNLLHVSDVTRAFVVALEIVAQQPPSEHVIYQVSSDEPLSLREVVALFEKVRGVSLPIEWGALPYRAREIFEPRSPAPRLPGWQQKIQLMAGLNTL